MIQNFQFPAGSITLDIGQFLGFPIYVVMADNHGTLAAGATATHDARQRKHHRNENDQKGKNLLIMFSQPTHWVHDHLTPLTFQHLHVKSSPVVYACDQNEATKYLDSPTLYLLSPPFRPVGPGMNYNLCQTAYSADTFKQADHDMFVGH